MKTITVTVVDNVGNTLDVEVEAGTTLRELIDMDEVTEWLDASGMTSEEDYRDAFMAIGDDPENMDKITSDFMRKRELRAVCEDGMCYGFNMEHTEDFDDREDEGDEQDENAKIVEEEAKENGIRFETEAQTGVPGYVNVSISAGLRTLNIPIEVGTTTVLDVLKMPTVAASMGIDTGSAEGDLQELLKYNITYGEPGSTQISALYAGASNMGLLRVTKPVNESTIYLDVRTASSEAGK